MGDKTINTKTEVRHVLTLFFSVGDREMRKRVESEWAKYDPTVDERNRRHHELERDFHAFCREWDLSDIEGLIVSRLEVRTTEVIERADTITRGEIRNLVKHEAAS